MTGKVIAIDGPSGSGKSTVAKSVAKELGLAYLDTGAMYRAATWWYMSAEQDMVAAVESMPLEISLDPQEQRFVCAGTDITAEIRQGHIAKNVSTLAVNLQVRALLVAQQQEIIRNELSGGFSNGRGIVVEGRDITTVVAPDAPVRVLLTASESARLARRAKENLGSADAAAVAATRDEVVRRDRDDSTVSNFTTAQDGVVTIDSSDMSIDQVVSQILELVAKAYDG